MVDRTPQTAPKAEVTHRFHDLDPAHTGGRERHALRVARLVEVSPLDLQCLLQRCTKLLRNLLVLLLVLVLSEADHG